MPVCCIHLSVMLSWINEKVVFKNLTKMLMCSYRGDVREWIWKFYYRGYGFISNVVTAFEYHMWKRYRVSVWWVVTYVIVVCNWKIWNSTCREGLYVRWVLILETKASARYGEVNNSQEFIKDNRVVCIIETYILVLKQTSIKSINKSG